MTPEQPSNKIEAPRYDEPISRDRVGPTNGLYTPMRGEGVLPDSVAVIPDTTNTMYSVERNNNISNLYSVGSHKLKEAGKASLPFVHGVELSGPKGENVRFRSVFDDGALANAIDERMYLISQNRLSTLEPSSKILKMADGRLVPSRGMWKGRVTVKGISHHATFEVLNSNGAWALLFGKPLLEIFNAVHDYSKDTISLPKEKGWVILENQFASTRGVAANLLANLTIDIKQLIDASGDGTPSPPRIIKTSKQSKDSLNTHNLLGGLAIPLEGSPIHQPPRELVPCLTNTDSDHRAVDVKGNADEPVDEWDQIWLLDPVAGNDPAHPGTEQPEIAKTFEPTLLTRKTDPHNPARVKAILAEITMGQDLTPAQRESTCQLIAEHAECFALSMSEVTPVDGASFRLDIPRDKQFRTKINQRPQSPPQKEFFNAVINKMIAADIIRPIAHQDVKCCGATTLAKKAHEGDGLTLDTLKHRINNECIAAGYPSAFEHLPPKEETNPDPKSPQTQNKWRVCQDFAELNQVTKVPPMPQGDIRLKQQNLSGHRWVTVFDFANGFYACEVKPEDQPYICFYVEGRGYFAYKRMPFGLTGAPSTFAEMTANALGDMIGTLLELFVDDGGLAGDVFETMLANTRRLLQRISKTGLSLSASKSKFFMTEATFAGGRVGPEGIKPDLTKLTAIADWKTPKDLQNLGSFLGLTGYFRPLIKGYASIAQPLTDLARNLELPKLKGKAAYTRAMKGFSLDGLWKREHDHAFLRLKVALTSEPVLKGPKYDGTPFIVTTDGCKYGFAGMLTQRFTTVLPNGTERTTAHPIGFASKRTSTTEEKYKPFILEFGALKHSLDKFSDIIWGYPIELETDCQALRDHLLSSTLNSTHARWRDAVLAHNIVDVRHRPGRLNVVADGLSRKFVNLPKEDGDGHEWTVSEDWEARTRLANDVFNIQTSQLESTYGALRTRFVNEKVFMEIIDSLLELDHGKSLKVQKRAKHKAKGYMIDEGRLWRIGDGSARAKARLECVTQEETVALAWEEHRNNGHFHRDNIKVNLLDKITSPKMDQSITKAILDCGKCKAFGTTHLHSLLEPITRRHPFELMVADTLSMPKGKGSYIKLGLWMDVYSQRVWVSKLKTAATGKTSKKSYSDICDLFTSSETLMTDGGPEFDNKELREECSRRGTKLEICPAYSPWVNGLLEGTNAILLNRLKRMCAPDLGEDDYTGMEIPANWPDHLETAIRCINNRVLPNLKYSPNELLLGLIINTRPTPLTAASAPPTIEEIETQMAYVDQHRFDGYSQIVEHAQRRKATFDKQILARPPQEVIFRAGDLVQVYRSDLDFTLATERKLLPKFSAPRRVVSRNQNSYQLVTLEGFPIAGKFSSRRLRRFLPRQGTELDKMQTAIEDEWRRREEEDDKVGSTRRDKENVREETAEMGTMATSGNNLKTEGMNQVLGRTCDNTRPVDVRANATRPLLICWGGTCDSGHHQGTPQTDDNGYKDQIR
jgi:hypothetical protein